MNHHELYLCLYQAVCHENGDAPIQKVKDFERTLEVYIARNSNTEISSVSFEFSGLKARFHCVLSFDGINDASIGLGGFFMPKVRLNSRQRVLALLSCLSFLIEAGLIDAEWPTVKDRIGAEFGNGAIGIYHQFDRQLEKAKLQATEAEEPPASTPKASSNDYKVYRFV